VFGSQDRLEDDLLAVGSHGDPATDARSHGWRSIKTPADARRGSREYDAHHKIVNCLADDPPRQAAGLERHPTCRSSGGSCACRHPNCELPSDDPRSSAAARDRGDAASRPAGRAGRRPKRLGNSMRVRHPSGLRSIGAHAGAALVHRCRNRGRPYIAHSSLPRAPLRCSDYPYFYGLTCVLKVRAQSPLVLLITDCNRSRIRHGYRCLYRRAYGGHDCERKRVTV
jgi:hypothetical protein